MSIWQLNMKSKHFFNVWNMVGYSMVIKRPSNEIILDTIFNLIKGIDYLLLWKSYKLTNNILTLVNTPRWDRSYLLYIDRVPSIQGATEFLDRKAT